MTGPFYDRVNFFGIAQTRNSPSRSKTVFPSIADSLSLFLPAFYAEFHFDFSHFSRLPIFDTTADRSGSRPDTNRTSL